MNFSAIAAGRCFDVCLQEHACLITRIEPGLNENGNGSFVTVDYVAECLEPLIIELLSPGPEGSGKAGVVLVKRWRDELPIERWVPKFFDSEQCLEMLLEEIEADWVRYEKRQGIKGSISL